MAEPALCPFRPPRGVCPPRGSHSRVGGDTLWTLLALGACLPPHSVDLITLWAPGWAEAQPRRYRALSAPSCSLWGPTWCQKQIQAVPGSHEAPMHSSEAPAFGHEAYLGGSPQWKSSLRVQHGVTRNGCDMKAFFPSGLTPLAPLTIDPLTIDPLIH